MREESKSIIIQDNVTFAAKTDVGMVRDHNEDNFLADSHLNLFIVADGMGGHAAGEVASMLAVQVVHEAVNEKRMLLEKFNRDEIPVTEVMLARQEILDHLTQAVRRASRKIWEQGQADPAKRGMGTTLEALLIAGGYGFVVHVGDSRIYLLRDNKVQQITEDHSLVNALIKEGRLKPDEAENFKHKNAVTRAVGVYETVEVDAITFDVIPGDEYLIASDGLTGYLKDLEIPPFMRETAQLDEVAERLVTVANERGGKDNITLIVVRVVDVEGVAKERCQQLSLRLDALGNIPMFRYLAYNELLKVFAMMTQMGLEKDKRIIEEGSTGDDMFVVIGGKVRVHSGETTITHLGPGDHFGEMSLVDKAPRSASITADEPTLLLRMTRSDFFSLIRKEGDTSKKILWNFLQVLTNRLRQTNLDLKDAKAAAEAEDLSDSILPLE
jgi:serine/threonine protein phosphatase PrpC/CRP-like cAMP-binding protein